MNDLYAQTLINTERPPEYIQERKAETRRRLGEILLDLLNSPDHPIYTVQLQESELPVSSFYPPGVVIEYQVCLCVTQARVMDVEIQRIEDLAWSQLSHSAVGEIKRRLRNWVRRLFK